jgi:hypothetical protein
MKLIKLAVRHDGTNHLHHLWNNNGTWWCQFTVHGADHTTQRARVSLKTRDLAEACRRRDRLFARLEGRAAA